MEDNDTLIRLLEECGETDRPAFTLAYVNGDLHVTPRHDAAARPAVISRGTSGYRIRYGTTSVECTAPDLAADAVQRIFHAFRPGRS